MGSERERIRSWGLVGSNFDWNAPRVWVVQPLVPALGAGVKGDGRGNGGSRVIGVVRVGMVGMVGTGAVEH